MVRYQWLMVSGGYRLNCYSMPPVFEIPSPLHDLRGQEKERE